MHMGSCKCYCMHIRRSFTEDPRETWGDTISCTFQYKFKIIFLTRFLTVVLLAMPPSARCYLGCQVTRCHYVKPCIALFNFLCGVAVDEMDTVEQLIPYFPVVMGTATISSYMDTFIVAVHDVRMLHGTHPRDSVSTYVYSACTYI